MFLGRVLSLQRLASPIRVLRKPRNFLPPAKCRLEYRHFHEQRSVKAAAMDVGGDRNSLHIFTIQVKGPDKEEEAGHKQQLISQLQNIPKNAQALRIEEDTPSDAEWSVISDHFSSVKYLEMETGFNEDLNDGKMPLHWPLERLQISSAGGEVFRSPFILDGKIKHLILLLTYGLRFEGPTSEELCRANKEAIARGDAEAEYITMREGTPEERKIEIVYVPKLVSQWMSEKYSRQGTASHPVDPPHNQINLEVLEILENDAIDTFSRMTVGLPHLVKNLKTLNLRSTHGFDFHYSSGEMFVEILPQLTGLQTLILSLGKVFHDEHYIPMLYKYFPPNLSVLRFRGPGSLAKSEQWKEWVESFAASEFLPNLKKLSFVLDLGRKEETEIQECLLREAKAACNSLYAIAEKRGISIESFHDEWAEHCKNFRQVDDRWKQL